MQEFAVILKFANRYSVEILIGFIGTALYLLPSWSESLEFNRSMIAQGQYWRLFTGQLVHFGLWHWWMDYAAILLAAFLSPIGMHWRGILQLVFSFFVVALVLWFLTDITHYRGISGVVYGWLLLAAIRNAWLGWVRKCLFAILLFGKVIYDMLMQSEWVVSEQWSEAKIAYEAHFAGLIAAVILLSFFYLRILLRQRQ